MNTSRSKHDVFSAISSRVLTMTAVAAVLMTPIPERAQSIDFDPVALGKQRAALCLKAGHASLPELESDVNHLAVLSETCRSHQTQPGPSGDETNTSGNLSNASHIPSPRSQQGSGQSAGVNSPW